MYEEFKKYVDTFDRSKYGMEHKYAHSFHVANLCLEFAKKMDLNEKDTKIIEQIGLLHDIGRFKQLDQYQSYNDWQNIDHGDAGINYLFEEGNIKKYKEIKEEDYEVIKTAIKYHNKYKIADHITGKTRFFCELIKDVDKLIILEEVIDGRIVLKDCDERVSERIASTFKNKQLVLKSNIQNDNDNTLMIFANIFDLNFKESFSYLKQHNIVERLKEGYNKPILSEYFDILKEYVDKKYKE